MYKTNKRESIPSYPLWEIDVDTIEEEIAKSQRKTEWQMLQIIQPSTQPAHKASLCNITEDYLNLGRSWHAVCHSTVEQFAVWISDVIDEQVWHTTIIDKTDSPSASVLSRLTDLVKDARKKAAIELLDSWLEEDEEEQISSLSELKKSFNSHRESYRKVF